jgi:hypothetical protein
MSNIHKVSDLVKASSELGNTYKRTQKESSLADRVAMLENINTDIIKMIKTMAYQISTSDIGADSMSSDYHTGVTHQMESELGKSGAATNAAALERLRSTFGKRPTGNPYDDMYSTTDVRAGRG